MAGKKILVVEDHAATQDMYRMALESAGYSVVTAGNGIKLIKLIREEQPDLVVMDIMMPWVDGFELCEAIRDIEEYKSLPIVVASAKSSPEDIQKALNVGANEYLEKPLELAHLVERAQHYIGHA